MSGDRPVESSVGFDDSTIDSLLREAAATSALSYPGRFDGTARFEVVKQIGEGGFGVVFEVLDRNESGRLALKLLRRPHADRLYRFKREFRALSELIHPNLVRLHELFAVGQDVFFTMELIDGVPLLTHVALDPARAREALRQLTAGLSALHGAGKLHRDVKPSNVMVESGGRVVLLDFGLAVEIDARDTVERAGTPLYMSPEQGAGRPLSEASDWYSVGVLLFEALTGRLPFDGSALEVIEAKQARAAPRPSELLPETPDDLDELCAALLARDPSLRPSGEQILRRLQSAPPSPALSRSEPFVGRTGELALLGQLADDAAGGRRVVALARAPSGMGKSALLRRFLDELRHRRPETLVLAGRCYERESVPYKALDAVIDELARALGRMSEVDAAALLPREALAVTKLFPVLRQVTAFQRAVGPRLDEDDPATVRARGIAGLRELFARLTDRRPVVVCVDDLQWGDVDSAMLLAELVRLPDPPAVFWLASFREEEAGTSPLIRRLMELRETTLRDVPIHELRLRALDGSEARRLAATLLTESRGDEARAEGIAAESGGSPFFVYELARLGDGAHALGELVRRRVVGLEGAARQILEVVAVGARPLALDVVLDARRGGRRLARGAGHFTQRAPGAPARVAQRRRTARGELSRSHPRRGGGGDGARVAARDSSPAGRRARASRRGRHGADRAPPRRRWRARARTSLPGARGR